MLLDRYIYRRIEESSGGRVISAAKAVSWRIVGTIDTMVISFLITGKPEIAISIASVEVITKMVLYYLHERVWERVRSK
ncbi:MAG: DUF2061 domain-containing protein [Cyclobacteriaceae bacterium]